ncbi:MAG: putative oxidoreductase [Pseudonocardiales bacterium]|jgi:putative oxidoreductase|nr:putative oxidoreductase [Pseudonocardiales bacterium]
MIDSEAVDAGILILRVVTGLTMAAHGYQKFFSGGRIAGTAGWFDSMGMRPGRIHALAAATTELGAGVLLALGFLTPLAGAAFVAVMLVAAYTVHLKNGFFSVRSGYEYNLILAVIGVVVGTTGPGAYSLDHAIGLDGALSGLVGFLIAAVGGVLAGSAQLAVFYRPATAPAS